MFSWFCDIVKNFGTLENCSFQYLDIDFSPPQMSVILLSARWILRQCVVQLKCFFTAARQCCSVQPCDQFSRTDHVTSQRETVTSCTDVCEGIYGFPASLSLSDCSQFAALLRRLYCSNCINTRKGTFSCFSFALVKTSFSRLCQLLQPETLNLNQKEALQSF